MSSHRIERVSDMVRASLSQLLLLEARDPRLRLVSVSSVRITPDLQVAEIGVSVTDPEQDRDDVLKSLRGAAGFLRSQLSRRLDLRHTPELRFHIDRGAEHSERIDQLLADLHLEDEAESSDASADSGEAPEREPGSRFDDASH